ncbi:dihydrofolate reductase [Nocardioides luteus]|uniref:Deaminase reductase n=1 Tax=Nocardioides luteus TaxID=1844 RepID=A0ABQ5SW21_9ACTN|nr:dihydrofolate reductase family protein [Nocardioides luteus]MDR7309342.1 dihydrofolate reductase [Nocardioides luteus]GGR50646.1 deaminase reductase [Nocardioides luteus]GLJ67748.1 deaminase reductase [Nocardioides luteus]
MRTLIYSAFVSLDGVVDSPGGGSPSEQHRSGGWTFKDIEFLPEAYAIKGREMEEAGALLFGRRSYEAFAPIWPDIEDFAVVKEIPKYVVSTSLGEDALVGNWGPQTILRSFDEVEQLKQGDGGPILVAGSAELARNMSDAGLIDRYHLLVFPVVLGAGKTMWSDTDKEKQRLTLVESEAYANGIVKLVYDVVR